MRALLTLWWWQWVTSAHERLHRNATPVWEASMREYDASVLTGGTETVVDSSEPNFTVTYGSDDG